MRHDVQVGMLSWWSCQSPIAHSCSLLNRLNNSHEGMFKLSTEFDAGLLLYSFSHFECDDHTVHMLAQRHLLPPLTSTGKSSLFMYVHLSTLSLAARLYRCCANCSHYINNGWTFPVQTLYNFKDLSFDLGRKNPQSTWNILHFAQNHEDKSFNDAIRG